MAFRRPARERQWRASQCKVAKSGDLKFACGALLSENLITQEELNSGEWDPVLWLDRVEFDLDGLGDDYSAKRSRFVPK